MRHWPLLWQLMQRELSQRLSASVLGAGWLLLQPLALLLMYGLVFEGIFRLRLPRENAAPFLLFVGLALWPWQAFADAVSRSLTAVTAQAALLKKVRLPAALLVHAVVGAAFAIQLLAYAVAVGTMALLWPGWLRLAGWPQALFCLMGVYAVTAGVGLAVAALNTYLRDVEQMVPQLLALGFFLTPVLYSMEMAPAWLQPVMALNPLAALLDGLRAAWLDGLAWPGRAQWMAGLAALVIFIGGSWLFRRLEPGFDQVL